MYSTYQYLNFLNKLNISHFKYHVQVIFQSMFKHLLPLWAHWSFNKRSAAVVVEPSISNTQYDKCSLVELGAFPVAVNAMLLAWASWAEAEGGEPDEEAIDEAEFWALFTARAVESRGWGGGSEAREAVARAEDVGAPTRGDTRRFLALTPAAVEMTIYRRGNWLGELKELIRA